MTMLNKEKFLTPFLNKNISIGIKGIAAIMVMLGHFTSDFPWYISMLFPGQCWVGIFFFYSGFGLQFKVNCQTFNWYYLIRKIKNILVPFWIAESLYTVSYIFLEHKQSIFEILLGCAGLKLYNTVLWYVIELVMLYILFFILTKFQITLIIWIPLYFLWLIVSVIFDIGTWWYISTSTFIFGIFYAKFFTTRKFFEKYNIKLLKVAKGTVIIWIICYLLRGWISSNSMLFSSIRVGYVLTALDMIIIPLFVIVIAFLSKIFKKVLYNQWCCVLGNISYTVYLYHMLVYLWIKSFFGNNVFTIFISTILTFMIGIGNYYIRQKYNYK